MVRLSRLYVRNIYNYIYIYAIFTPFSRLFSRLFYALCTPYVRLYVRLSYAFRTPFFYAFFTPFGLIVKKGVKKRRNACTVVHSPGRNNLPFQHVSAIAKDYFTSGKGTKPFP